MSLLFPTFFVLAAILSIAIPLVIHLFQFRRYKTVYFSNVKFLKEVKEQKQNRTRIKYWLVLFSRILALLFLALAFAQPFIPSPTTKVVKGFKAISIYLDNSFSMDALSKDVSLFEKARFKAREIVDAYDPDDRFQILTNDFEAAHQRLVNKEEVLNYIDEIEISAETKKLSQVIERQKEVLNQSEAEQKNIFFISDFQENMVDAELKDTLLNYRLIPLQSVEQHNVFIDSVGFLSPVRQLHETNQLLIKIRNTGTTDVNNTRLSLQLNGAPKAVKDVSVPASSFVIDTLTFTVNEAGWNEAMLEITDYPINFDDRFYFTFQVASAVNVLSINENSPNHYITTLFNEDNYFELSNQNVQSLSYDKLGGYRLIILNQLSNISSGLGSELKTYVEAGGNLLIFPSQSAEQKTYNAFLSSVQLNTISGTNNNRRNSNYINGSHEIFKGVFEKIPDNIDLPYANNSLQLTRYSNTNEQVLLRFKDGGSLLSQYSFKGGKIYLAATSLNTKQTNLPTHGIFVPMLYQMALVGGSGTLNAFTLGQDEIVEVKANAAEAEELFSIIGEGAEFIPGQKRTAGHLNLSLHGQLKEAGIYQLVQKGQALAQKTSLAFNFNRLESELTYLNIGDLKDRFQGPTISIVEAVEQDLSTLVGRIDDGTPLWKYCIILCLVFLAVEVLLLRLWK